MGKVLRDPRNPKQWKIDYLTRAPDGSRVHVFKTGFYSKYEADREIPRTEAERLAKIGFKSIKGKFSLLVDAFLEYKKDKMKISSWYSFQAGVNKHIGGYFMGFDTNVVFMQKHLQDFRKHVSNLQIVQTRKNRILKWFYSLSDFAVTRKLISTDMFLIAKIATEEIRGQETPPRRYVVWTKEEYRIFINTFSDNDRNKILFQLMFFSGCRAGEIRALTWGDFNPVKKTLLVDKSIISKTGTGKYIVSTTKTKAGNRIVWLSDKMNERLLALRNHYTDWAKEKYIFFNASKPIGHTTITTHFNKHILLAKLPHMRLHDIRHTSNTWLHNLASSREEEEAIKKRLGHVSDAMSLGTYYHHSEDSERRLADLIEI